MVAICRQEVRESFRRVNRGPVQQILFVVNDRNLNPEKNTERTLSCDETSGGKDEPNIISKPFASSRAFSEKLSSSQRISLLNFADERRVAS